MKKLFGPPATGTCIKLVQSGQLYPMKHFPKREGYKMPGEWSPHSRTWMLYPSRPDIWRQDAHGQTVVRKSFKDVVDAISQFEPVFVGVDSENKEAAHLDFQESTNVNIFDASMDDIWARDTGPSFLLHPNGTIAGVNWGFNSWGLVGMVDGVNYIQFDKDATVSNQILALSSASRTFSADFILEGGSFHVDGEGTIITTEECLLNSNRNPSMTKQEIEEGLINYLGGEKVIWLPRGLVADEDTNGHVDNICCFVEPGHVLLAWSDDPSDEQFHICREDMAVLLSTPDAKGRPLKVTKMPLPPPLYYTEEECAGMAKWGDASPRQPGTRLAGSYVNFYIANGGIVCPAFGADSDAEAVAVLESVFPGRKVVSVLAREILLGGGNIHCITQQEPLPLPSPL